MFSFIWATSQVGGSGGGGGGAVSSVFGRAGIVTAQSGDYSAAQITGLAVVATSGAYADLSGKPTLAAVATSGAYSDLTGTPTLAPVATSGAYADLSGTPTLAAVATSGAYSDLTGTPTLAPVATSGAYADLSGTPTLAAVATSGAYSDLSGTPDLSTKADTNLGNLASVAIATDILPSVGDTYSIGALGNTFTAGYFGLLSVQEIHDDSNVLSVSSVDRLLADFTGVTSLGFSSRQLFNSTSSVVLDWETGGVITVGASILPASAGGASLGNGSVPFSQLFVGQIRRDSGEGPAGRAVLDAANFLLYNSSESVALDFSSDLKTNSNFKPGADNSYTLGTGALRWGTLYLAYQIRNASQAVIDINSRVLYNAVESPEISWGSGITLNQVTANTVLTLDGSQKIVGVTGASGTFTTTDLKTVTVVNGIITSIV